MLAQQQPRSFRLANAVWNFEHYSCVHPVLGSRPSHGRAITQKASSALLPHRASEKAQPDVPERLEPVAESEKRRAHDNLRRVALRSNRLRNVPRSKAAAGLADGHRFRLPTPDAHYR